MNAYITDMSFLLLIISSVFASGLTLGVSGVSWRKPKGKVFYNIFYWIINGIHFKFNDRSIMSDISRSRKISDRLQKKLVQNTDAKKYEESEQFGRVFWIMTSLIILGIYVGVKVNGK